MSFRVACLLLALAVAFTEVKSDLSLAELEQKVNQFCDNSDQVKSNSDAIQELAAKVDELPEIVDSIQKLRSQIESVQLQISDFLNTANNAQENSRKIAEFEQQVANLGVEVNKQLEKSGEKFEDIQKALEDVTEEEDEWEDVLSTVLSIDRSKYYASRLYKNQIYIASKDGHDFDLHGTNEECKSNGGYLVEFDDADEIQFVRDFMKITGHGEYYTGANDADTEGTFVYYNSKKPVVNLDWKSNEPNNYGGNEDCVEIQLSGFNDHRCDRSVRYMCEIPLF